MTDVSRGYTVSDLADRYGVNASKIGAWIKSGELRAIDVSARRGKKPRWRILPEALAEFEAARSSRTATSATPRRSPRRRPAGEVIEFF